MTPIPSATITAVTVHAQQAGSSSVILIAIVIGVVLIYALGYSAGKQSIRDQFHKLVDRKGRR
jgi:xanthine/uracil permease